jgi:ribosome-associated protein
MATPETRRQLLAAVAACEDKKGEDTRILELDAADSGLADFFLITSATNDRQVVAIADEIEMRLKKEFGLYPASVEGRRQAEWILLDYVDIVIHVFLQEKRAFYDIERLRKSARNLSGPEVEKEFAAELKTALAQKTRAVRSSAPAPSGTAKLNATRSQKLSKGDSTVSAKQAKKAVKPAAKKAPAKTVAKKAAPSKAPAKKSSAKPGKKIAAKAAAKPIKKAAAKATLKKAAKPAAKIAKVVAPPAPAAKMDGVLFTDPIQVQGAKPPVLKAEAPPEMLDMAASATPTAAKPAGKKSAKSSKSAS